MNKSVLVLSIITFIIGSCYNFHHIEKKNNNNDIKVLYYNSNNNHWDTLPLKGKKWISIKKDSIVMQTEKKCVNCDYLNIIYNENGEMIEKFCQGHVQNNTISTGMYVGTRYLYKNKKIVYEIIFNNDDFGLDYNIYKIYGDSVYKEIFTNNFDLYETDSIVLSDKEISKRIKNRHNIEVYFNYNREIKIKKEYNDEYNNYPFTIYEYNNQNILIHQYTQGFITNTNHIGKIGKEYFWDEKGYLKKIIDHSIVNDKGKK